MLKKILNDVIFVKLNFANRLYLDKLILKEKYQMEKVNIDIDKFIEKIRALDTFNILESAQDFFETYDNCRETAFLNWRFEPHEKPELHFLNMAKGYFEVSIELLIKCLNENSDRKADIWIFPILFNVIHGIEIYLKSFNSAYNLYSKLCQHELPHKSNIEGKHNIKQLCSTAIKKVKDSGKKEFLEELEFVKKFIELIYQKTNNMSFARYPISTKNETQFYVSDKNVTIDIKWFLLMTTKTYLVLDNICEFIYFESREMESLLYEFST